MNYDYGTYLDLFIAGINFCWLILLAPIIPMLYINNIKISSTTCTVDNSDIIVVLVAHDIYKDLKISKEKILLDFVNIIS